MATSPTTEPYIPLDRVRPSDDDLATRARAFFERMVPRRSIRDFSDRPVPRDVIADCLLAAGRAPSGANQQPWTFVAVSDPALKRRLRLAAEEEERAFYEHRAPQVWLNALAPLGTDAHKPFLETAPWLIAIFAQRHGLDADGEKVKHYYVTESVGIATGFLITALHHAGLACLTHTPSPMGFLNELLERPDHEKAFLLLVVGHPADGVEVPAITKKPLEEIAEFREG